jgi:hypothetical protein
MKFRHMAAAALLLATTSFAYAANDEGRIASIDREAMIITLENGNSYKLPGEFDMEAIAEGMEVLVAYDTVDGERTITDMDITE